MGENCWVAAGLNFFTYGLGYLYIGEKKLFGIALTFGRAALYASFFWGLAHPLPQSTVTYQDILSLGIVVIAIACAYDAFQLAKRMETP
jgi:hypothetical protein